MKILMVVPGFGEPILSDKVKFLEHNLKVLEKTREKDCEIDVKVYCYADTTVSIESPFPIEVIYEKGIIGQFLYRHVRPDFFLSYDYIIISMDDIWLNEEFKLSEFMKRDFYWDILSPCLENGTLHRHAHMLKKDRTGTIFHEGLELFFYIMPRESYIHYWNVFVDDENVSWLWAVDYILGRKGFKPYMDCDVTMKHLHLGSSLNVNAYLDSVYNEEKHLVPLNIFQIWINEEPIGEDTKEWRESWKTLNPAFKYYFITKKGVSNLITDKFPQLLTIYNSYSKDVMRSDLARYIYMYAFGGVYADNDFQCLKCFDSIVLYIQQTTKHDMGLDIMFGKLDGNPEEFLHSIPNSLIISKKGCHFWKFLIQVITNMGVITGLPVEMTTGSALLYVCIKYYTEGNDILAKTLYGRDIFQGIDISGKKSKIGYAEPYIFYPYTWHKKSDDLSQSYAVTYWQHRW